MVTVNPAEADRLILEKAENEDRRREEAEAKDLLEFLGDDAQGFDFNRWAAGEREILKAALERRGFSRISFHMVEEDSHGPLIRGAVATNPDGKRVRFFYG